MEGFATNRRELVLLGFIPHDERKFNFNLAFGFLLSVMRIAQKYEGRNYTTGLHFTGFAEQILGREVVERLRQYKQPCHALCRYTGGEDR